MSLSLNKKVQKNNQIKKDQYQLEEIWNKKQKKRNPIPN